MGDAKRLRELEDENRRLERLVADQALDISLLREVNRKKMQAAPEAYRAGTAVRSDARQ